MIEPYFSIVIPTYNREKFIGKAIASVLAQDYKRFELIIIDDGSTDNTLSEVRKFQDERIVYIKKENGERGAARNHGARLAKGDFINFFDSDDTLYPYHLSEARHFIQKSAEVKVFHLGYDIKDPHGNTVRKMPVIDSINKKILDGNFLSCNGVFIRRDIAIQNPFNEDRQLSALEDWELWIRLSSRHKFYHVGSITSTVIHHDERSVFSGDGGKLEAKAARFIHYVLADATNQKIYSSELKKTVSSAYMYTSLHLGMAGAGRGKISSYLIKGVAQSWRSIFTKRFLVILKFLVVGNARK